MRMMWGIIVVDLRWIDRGGKIFGDMEGLNGMWFVVWVYLKGE